MKKFKILDYSVSTILIVTFLLTAPFNHELIFVGYAVIGAWQIASMLIHTYKGCLTYTGSARYYYHWVTCICILLLPLGLLYVLYYIAPILAVSYTVICYHEVHVKMQRPLAVIK